MALVLRYLEAIVTYAPIDFGNIPKNIKPQDMKAKTGFELQNVCGEYIIVPTGIENVDFSRIISLNPTAAFLWEKVSDLEEFSIDTMVEALLEEYEVEEAIAREDCGLIVERWSEMGLIEE